MKFIGFESQQASALQWLLVWQLSVSVQEKKTGHVLIVCFCKCTFIHV